MSKTVNRLKCAFWTMHGCDRSIHLAPSNVHLVSICHMFIIDHLTNLPLSNPNPLPTEWFPHILHAPCSQFPGDQFAFYKTPADFLSCVLYSTSGMNTSTWPFREAHLKRQKTEMKSYNMRCFDGHNYYLLYGDDARMTKSWNTSCSGTRWGGNTNAICEACLEPESAPLQRPSICLISVSIWWWSPWTREEYMSSSCFRLLAVVPRNHRTELRSNSHYDAIWSMEFDCVRIDTQGIPSGLCKIMKIYLKEIVLWPNL